jgi:hypothetical protein
MAIEIINAADLKDRNDPQERTYRQVNAEKVHAIPLGALVGLEDGERMFIKRHTRDCDMTPLYSVGMKDDEVDSGLMCKWHHGYGEENLTIINGDEHE